MNRLIGQVSIPLARMSAARVAYCYELMDAAYDCAEIRAHASRTGHVAIIDINPRRNTELKAALAQEARAQRVAGHIDPGRKRSAQRSSVERVNSMLKESYGGRTVRVRGSVKVACHLTLGILALTIDQLMRLAAGRRIAPTPVRTWHPAGRGSMSRARTPGKRRPSGQNPARLRFGSGGSAHSSGRDVAA